MSIYSLYVGKSSQVTKTSKKREKNALMVTSKISLLVIQRFGWVTGLRGVFQCLLLLLLGTQHPLVWFTVQNNDNLRILFTRHSKNRWTDLSFVFGKIKRHILICASSILLCSRFWENEISLICIEFMRRRLPARQWRWRFIDYLEFWVR